MTIKLSVGEAVWGINSLKKIGYGVVSEGIALPAALVSIYRDYLREVKGLTPPATGGTVGSIAYARGKAAITVDLHKAFTVVLKSSGVKGGRAVTVFNNALDWYLSNRTKKGRFNGTVKMTVDLPTFRAIERTLHQRIGWLQAGWNAACKQFQVPVESWVKNKTAPGSVQVVRKGSTLLIQARNDVRFADRIQGLQRDINRAGYKRVREIERAIKTDAEERLRKAFR